MKTLLLKLKNLRTEIYVLFLAFRDPRVPWYAKVLVFLVVAYALSPVDIVPDFIPVLGYLDDLLVLPLGIFLAIRLIPAEVLVECRRKARADVKDFRMRWVGLGLVIIAWLVLLAVILLVVLRTGK